jgi:hypothetical protein
MRLGREVADCDAIVSDSNPASSQTPGKGRKIIVRLVRAWSGLEKEELGYGVAPIVAKQR